MKWFRSRVRFGSRLALFALVIQFLLSFGHFHGSAQAASRSVDARRSGLHDTIDLAVAHMHGLSSVSYADAASGPVRSKSSSDVPAEDCAICAIIALANTLVNATPPCLLSPQSVAFDYLAAEAEFVDPNPAHGAFQPRAPPIG
jgi:hypothetical protein